jgi:hypothetical protein
MFSSTYLNFSIYLHVLHDIFVAVFGAFSQHLAEFLNDFNIWEIGPSAAMQLFAF